MAAHEFTVTGDPRRAKQTAIDALVCRDFAVEWTDEWTALAKKGSRIKNALLGAFAQYFELRVEIRSLDETTSVIRIATMSSGYMGGVWGAKKTKQNFATLRDELGHEFERQGVLVSHRDPDAS